MNNNNRNLKLLAFIALAVLGIVLLILPGNYFDTGKSICLSVVLFDMECYGCGMTRAIQHLIHFEFKEAFAYNKLSLIVLPLFIYLIIVEIIKLIKEKETEKP